jgi:hypothetical protein
MYHVVFYVCVILLFLLFCVMLIRQAVSLMHGPNVLNVLRPSDEIGHESCERSDLL